MSRLAQSRRPAANASSRRASCSLKRRALSANAAACAGSACSSPARMASTCVWASTDRARCGSTVPPTATRETPLVVSTITVLSPPGTSLRSLSTQGSKPAPFSTKSRAFLTWTTFWGEGSQYGARPRAARGSRRPRGRPPRVGRTRRAGRTSPPRGAWSTAALPARRRPGDTPGTARRGRGASPAAARGRRERGTAQMPAAPGERDDDSQHEQGGARRSADHRRARRQIERGGGEHREHADEGAEGPSRSGSRLTMLPPQDDPREDGTIR